MIAPHTRRVVLIVKRAGKSRRLSDLSEVYIKKKQLLAVLANTGVSCPSHYGRRGASIDFLNHRKIACNKRLHGVASRRPCARKVASLPGASPSLVAIKSVPVVT